MNTVRLSGVSLGFVLALTAITTFNVAEADARGRGGRVAGAIAAGVILGAILSESTRASAPPKRSYREEPPRRAERKRRTRTTATPPRRSTVRTSSETRERVRSEPASTSSSSSMPRPELPGGEGLSSSTPSPTVARAPADTRPSSGTSLAPDMGGNSKIPD